MIYDGSLGSSQRLAIDDTMVPGIYHGELHDAYAFTVRIRWAMAGGGYTDWSVATVGAGHPEIIA
ncbi:MAG: hypothetical protein ACRBK7_12165 [Acidimicrobiales bacterium]